MVMIESLLKNLTDATVWVLCLDDECIQILNSLNRKSIKTISLSDIEKSFPKLLVAKKNRSISEYYFTLSPFLPRYLLDRNESLNSITYLDADLEFFSSPIPLFDDGKNCSIGIIEHRFHPSFDQSKHCGRFNVGWVYFRNDEIARKCLCKWCNQCLEWCGDTPSQNRFADQKYLDLWPHEYKNVHIYNHPGANLAPWNLNNHNIQVSNNLVLTDSLPLIFYHFHMIRIMERNYIYSGLDLYHVPVEIRHEIINSLYVPHITKLLQIESLLQKKGFKAKALRTIRDNAHIEKLDDKYKSLDQRLKNGEVFQIC